MWTMREHLIKFNCAQFAHMYLYTTHFKFEFKWSNQNFFGRKLVCRRWSIRIGTRSHYDAPVECNQSSANNGINPCKWITCVIISALENRAFANCHRRCHREQVANEKNWQQFNHIVFLLMTNPQRRHSVQSLPFHSSLIKTENYSSITCFNWQTYSNRRQCLTHDNNCTCADKRKQIRPTSNQFRLCWASNAFIQENIPGNGISGYHLCAMKTQNFL